MNRRPPRCARLLTLAATLVLALVPTAAGADTGPVADPPPAAGSPAGGGEGDGAWELVPAPELDGQVSLHGVTATGPRDAWAVGTISDGLTIQTLTLHWDGTTWTRVPSPNRTDESWLFSVDATSPSDAWAVGYDRGADNRHRTLILHWDGQAWSVVPSPDPGAEGSLLNDVAAVSDGEAWAVGSSTVAFPLLGETLALRWDGEAWARVPSPNPSVTGTGSNLHSVDVAPDGTAWSTGAVDRGDYVMGTMAMRWERGRWALVPTPGGPNASLAGAVAASGPRSAWAVGWHQDDAGGTHALAMQYRRGRWATTPVPTDPAADASLADVVVVRGRAWAVGSQGTSALAARWDGRRWSLQPTADPGTVANSLIDIDAVPRSRCLWAVGQSTDGARGRALIERHCP